MFCSAWTFFVFLVSNIMKNILSRIKRKVKKIILYCMNIRYYVFERSNLYRKMKQDTRFNITDFWLTRLLSVPIKNYEVISIKLGDIKREWQGEIISLDKTPVYAYVKNGDEEGYRDYVRQHIPANTDKNIAEDIIENDLARFKGTIESVMNNGYDVQRCAVILNGDNVILDGVHRSCIAFSQFGAEHEISVLRVCYK